MGDLQRETSVIQLNTVSRGKRAISHGKSASCNCTDCDKQNLTIPVQSSKSTKKELRPSHLHEMAAAAVQKNLNIQLILW